MATKSSRRSFLKAAPALAGGLAALRLPSEVLAASPEPKKASDKAEKGKVWSSEYWAQNGDIKLYMFRKRMTPPSAGKLPVLFLSHGSSLSARPNFDLTVNGSNKYSFMDKFASFGFDVWTMDYQGYGRSTIGKTNSDVAEGVRDLKAGMEVVAKETGQQRYHFFGESSGGLRAAAFAVAMPERVDRLVLAAFTYTGEGSSTLADRAKQVDFYRTHTRRPRDRDMIRSIFTRDKVGTSDMAVAEALADVEMPLGDSVPTGTYLDMVANLPLIDPLKVHGPVLMARGEYDGIATNSDLLKFFEKLPNGDRQFILMPGMAHSLVLGLNHDLFAHTMRAFLEMPARVDTFPRS